MLQDALYKPSPSKTRVREGPVVQALDAMMARLFKLVAEAMFQDLVSGYLQPPICKTLETLYVL